MKQWKEELKFKSIKTQKLLEYGFIQENEKYIFKTKIVDQKFEVYAVVQNGQLQSYVWDVENDCEYILVNVLQATGEFVGRVRTEYETKIKDIISQCTETDVFRYPQTLIIVEYIRQRYHDELEFLWEKSPDTAIWRNKFNQKWYGLLFGISKNKLGIDSSERIEALNLLFSRDEINSVVDYQHIFPGYHMNKKSWITIVLDQYIENDKIFSWIDKSYEQSIKK